MKCIICNKEMLFYFSKEFNEFALKRVDYYKCINCGFVSSKTHYDMNLREWEELNYNFHNAYNKTESGPNRPPYYEQAGMFNLLIKNNLIACKNLLDWGAGEGELSLIMKKYFGISLLNYDKYINKDCKSDKLITENEKFNLVITGAVFEHLRDRKTFEEINNLVDEKGALAVHTLVRGEIPKDPDWMYLLPVHCSFHTNESMSVLFNDWDYKCSLYSSRAKTWIFFKNNCRKIKATVGKINKEIGTEYLLYADKFLDYWH